MRNWIAFGIEEHRVMNRSLDMELVFGNENALGNQG